MAASAQACHDLIPPENLHTMVRKIADEFVSDGVASEVAAAGLNTIKEICTRAPLAIDEVLLQDLAEYRDSKAKGVNMAAKALVTLYREVAPEMLKRKHRGKHASMELQEAKRGTQDSKRKRPQFGVESGNVEGIAGIELLAKWKQTQEGGELNEEDEANWQVDEEMGSDDDVEGEWINIESDKEYEVDLNDSDEESAPAKKSYYDDDDEDQDKEKTGDSEPKEDVAQIDPETAFRELASTRILTPADFAKLQELRMEDGVSKLMGGNGAGKINEEVVDSRALLGPMKYKQNREERLQSIMEGREGRDKYSSRRGKRDGVHSTTNREKARKKNFVMMIHKKSVQGKQKMSLRDKQKVLRAHITKQKKKGF